jgi:hypothetical protein
LDAGKFLRTGWRSCRASLACLYFPEVLHNMNAAQNSVKNQALTWAFGHAETIMRVESLITRLNVKGRHILIKSLLPGWRLNP